MEQIDSDIHSESHQHCNQVIHIAVNGQAEIWNQPKMNYEQVVKLAFPNGPWGGDIRYSVTWTKLNGQEGSLRPSSKPVDVEEGMMFDVRNTDKS